MNTSRGQQEQPKQPQFQTPDLWVSVPSCQRKENNEGILWTVLSVLGVLRIHSNKKLVKLNADPLQHCNIGYF